MKVAKGYKQTELGAIPEDWQIVSLGELFDFKNGLNKEKKYFGYGTPIVNYMDVYKNRSINENNIGGKVFLSKQEIKNYEVRQGDVFFTRTSETVEEVGMTSVVLDPLENTVFSGFVLRARPKNEKLNNDFKKYCFSSTTTRKEIVSNSTYTTRALTNGKALSKVKIAIPISIDEQLVIANALSETDALIANLEKLIVKKQNIRQAAMQVLLTGKKRLKGFKGEWKKMTLKQVGECIRGVSYNGDNDLSELETHKTCRLFRSNNIQNGKIEFTNVQYVRDYRVNNKQYMQPNDILICMANGSKELVGKAAIFNATNAKYTFGAFMGCFRTLVDSVDKRFIYYNFCTYNYRTHIDILLSGSSINNLKPSDIESIEILVPTFSEQQAITAVLSDMDSEIEALQQQLSKYKLMKEGMMQDLLTGKVRLI